MFARVIRNIKLQKKFFFIVGSLSCAALYGLIQIVVQEQQSSERADRAERISTVLVLAERAATYQALETARSMLAFPPRGETRQQLLEYRMLADAYLDSALQIAVTISQEAVGEHLAALQHARIERNALRQRLDAMRTDADNSFSIETWLDAQRQLAQTLHQACLGLFFHEEQTPDLYELHRVVWSSAYRAYSLLGEERAIVARLLSRQSPLEPSLYARMLMLKGELEEQIGMILSFHAHPAANPELIDALQAMEHNLRMEYEPLLQTILTGVYGRRSYSVSSDEWFQTVTQALSSVGGVATAVNRRAHELIAVQQRESRWGILLGGTFLFLLLLVILASLSMVRMIVAPLREVAHQATVIAAGDLRIVETPELEAILGAKDEMGELGRGFSKMVWNLRDMVGRIVEASSSVSQTSLEISSSAEQLAAGAEEQADQSREVKRAVEEMTRTIEENSAHANEVALQAREARTVAEAGGTIVLETAAGIRQIEKSVAEASQVIQSLGTSSQHIGEVVALIEEIADQTNLLALNAAIEAARAGEHGRGFSVVADEVRRLAERTTQATKQIGKTVEGIQKGIHHAVDAMAAGVQQVNSGVRLAEQSGAVLRQIVEKIQYVTRMMEQIATATEHQSSASEQISRNVEAISTVTQQTAGSTHQLAQASQNLEQLVENLHALIQRFILPDEIAARRHAVSSETLSVGESFRSSNTLERARSVDHSITVE